MGSSESMAAGSQSKIFSEELERRLACVNVYILCGDILCGDILCGDILCTSTLLVTHIPQAADSSENRGIASGV